MSLSKQVHNKSRSLHNNTSPCILINQKSKKSFLDAVEFALEVSSIQSYTLTRETMPPIVHPKFNPLPPSDAVRQQKRNILEDISSSVLSQFKNITPLEFWNLII